MSNKFDVVSTAENNLRAILNSNIGNKLTGELATGIFGVFSSALRNQVAQAEAQQQAEKEKSNEQPQSTTPGFRRILPRQANKAP